MYVTKHLFILLLCLCFTISNTYTIIIIIIIVADDVIVMRYVLLHVSCQFLLLRKHKVYVYNSMLTRTPVVPKNIMVDALIFPDKRYCTMRYISPPVHLFSIMEGNKIVRRHISA